MRDPLDYKSDPTKFEACVRLEKLGASIGPIDDESVHVELKPSFGKTPIGDAQMAGVVDDVNALQNVATLDLSETEITDASASEFARLRTVTALYLGGLRITDSTLLSLAAIPTLRELVLSGTEITDAGLISLAAAKRLKSLQLYDTEVTEDGISELQASLPDVEVES